MNSKSLILVCFAFVISACGGGQNPDVEAARLLPASQAIGSQKLEVLEGSATLLFSNGSLTGNGLIRFADPLEGAETANNFSMTFSLDDGGSITLIANANRDLTGGVEFEISRPNGSNELKVKARTTAGERDLSSALEGKINVAQEITLWFDVHNDHSDSVHVVAWNQASGEELTEDVVPGKGVGASWGLRLQGGRVENVSRSEARDRH